MNIPTVLLDMDGVGADFNRGIEISLQESGKLGPEGFATDITHFYVAKMFPELDEDIRSIYTSRGFFRNLPLIDGYVELIEALEGDGVEVQICTSPIRTNPYSEAEKLQWLAEHVSEQHAEKAHVTSDKETVYGHLLIDDRPEIKVASKPSWVQGVYDQPWNQNSEVPIRINSLDEVERIARIAKAIHVGVSLEKIAKY